MLNRIINRVRVSFGFEDKAELVKSYEFIRELELDWSKFYSANSIESDLEPEWYFVLNAKKVPLVLPGVIDVAYYYEENPDVFELGVNPLVHFELYGKAEGRKGFDDSVDSPFLGRVNSKKQREHEHHALNNAGMDWADYGEIYSLEGDQECISHYIENWKVLKPIVPGFFHTRFYLDEYEDIKAADSNPLVHFVTRGMEEGRKGFKWPKNSKERSLDELASLLTSEQKLHEYRTLEKLGIVWGDYFEVNEIEDSERSDDPLMHYVLNWDKKPLVVAGVFDTGLYLENYPDIAINKINPLIHYLLHGKAEGRVGYFKLEDHLVDGGVQYNPELKSLVVASHESSATGAPLVGFNIGDGLNERFNIIQIIFREGKLHDAFLDSCCLMISDINCAGSSVAKRIFDWLSTRYELAGVICNSVETFAVLEAANALNIPTVSLVHEFSEYSRPVGKIANTALLADRVVVPAKIVKNSICRELKSFYALTVEPNNIVVQPQGKLNFIPEGHGENDSIEELYRKLGITDRRTKVLLGAGYVQIRKGVDLFISAAKQIEAKYRGKCKFVWVGEGYSPETDLNYSNWLQTQIELAGLSDDIVFLGHQRNLDNLLAITDVFCMTSRLDPFPNVVIDAMTADVHVACFENSTGCAEFMLNNNANCTAVDYLDTEKFAKGVVAFLNNKKPQKGVNEKLVREKLNFDNYLESLVQLLADAASFREEVTRISDVILESGEFDNDYHHVFEDERTSVSKYVEGGLKGLHLFNPKPGFNDREWIRRVGGNNEYQVPLFEALDPSSSPETHRAIRLDGDGEGMQLPADFRYAVHLHLFYVVLAEEFAEYFSNLPQGFDLFITCVDESVVDSLQEVFTECGAGDISITVVENIGRDVVPFFETLRNDLYEGDYDAVGHFHSKKSYEVSEDMGDSWRGFLVNTLIGDNKNALKVLSVFNDSGIGLVFADDRHGVDEGENREYIDVLCEDMGIDRPDHTCVFPLGTMFWARPAAFGPFLKLDFGKYIVPEPLPYDGSYMHAIERVMPAVVKSEGYNLVTVSKEGAMW